MQPAWSINDLSDGQNEISFFRDQLGEIPSGQDWAPHLCPSRVANQNAEFASSSSLFASADLHSIQPRN